MTAPRRRWSFGLTTLLLAMLIAGMILGWVGNSLHWIRQRRAALKAAGVQVSWGDVDDPFSNEHSVEAPGMLWLFGEKGVYYLGFSTDRETAAKKRDELRRIFPEANVQALVVRRNPEDRF